MSPEILNREFKVELESANFWIRHPCPIHPHRLESSKSAARLSGSLVVSGSGWEIQCLPEVKLMVSAKCRDSFQHLSTRLNKRRLEVTRRTKPRHDTRHTMHYSFNKRVQTNNGRHAAVCDKLTPCTARVLTHPLLVCPIFPKYSPVRNKNVITENLSTALDLTRALFRDTEQTNPYGRTTKASLS